jgi:hypothetical protein
MEKWGQSTDGDNRPHRWGQLTPEKWGQSTPPIRFEGKPWPSKPMDTPPKKSWQAAKNWHEACNI